MNANETAKNGIPAAKLAVPSSGSRHHRPVALRCQQTFLLGRTHLFAQQRDTRPLPAKFILQTLLHRRIRRRDQRTIRLWYRHRPLQSVTSAPDWPSIARSVQCVPCRRVQSYGFKPVQIWPLKIINGAPVRNGKLPIAMPNPAPGLTPCISREDAMVLKRRLYALSLLCCVVAGGSLATLSKISERLSWRPKGARSRCDGRLQKLSRRIRAYPLYPYLNTKH